MDPQAETGLVAAVTPIIIGHEGEKLHVYDDIYGIPSIGVGFNLTRSDAAAICQRCGANYQRLLGGIDTLTEAQSSCLLQYCIIEVIEWETKVFPGFWTFTRPRQIALLDMGFNLGETKFLGFKSMISCILAGNWPGAASQAGNSHWATELPTRSAYDIGLLRAG